MPSLKLSTEVAPMPKTTPFLPYRILLLEDDFTLSTIIDEFLTDQGYEVVCVYDGEKAIDMGYEKTFDLFLLDVKVPYCSGFDVLRELRAQNKNTPTIFITSLGGLEDLSLAYEVGCDDYLKKPFELKELELRIKALLKRSAPQYVETRITFHETFTFDTQLGRLTTQEGSLVLPKKEAKILRILLSSPNGMVTTQTLLESAWDFNEEATEENLRTLIKNLRKYLGKETIQNIRGQGYLIEKS